MTDFAAFFASGQVADLMVAVLLVEALALLAFWRLTGRGLSPRSIAALVLPGVFFALALRAALTGAWWGFVSLSLTAAFFAHACDVWRRLRG
ncbi:MAG: hypothetical protein INF75_14490 [Roseomonas sp.]|nr:hypothetical protein [Roseomonas sp.]MCA3329266.1 hypothetical protein [Roseomonas sp.]MCA3332309.1 hypothetical protein [Roseomonas sp.]MCA3335670.1 hypothetical protein [Roseomonas sp.]MCA3345968.1 hypothetical protein [Roseomonas sp.]